MLIDFTQRTLGDTGARRGKLKSPTFIVVDSDAEACKGYENDEINSRRLSQQAVLGEAGSPRGGPWYLYHWKSRHGHIAIFRCSVDGAPKTETLTWPWGARDLSSSALQVSTCLFRITKSLLVSVIVGHCCPFCRHNKGHSDLMVASLATIRSRRMGT